MLIGYMRVSKTDCTQALDLQRDALLATGVKSARLYEDQASGKRDDRPGLEACLKSLRRDDTLVALEERTKAGLASARARGRHGGRPYKMTPAKLGLAQAAMGRRETGVGELCLELGITRQTLYRHVDRQGRLRPDGEKLLRHRHAGREQGLPADAPGRDAGERHA